MPKVQVNRFSQPERSWLESLPVAWRDFAEGEHNPAQAPAFSSDFGCGYTPLEFHTTSEWELAGSSEIDGRLPASGRAAAGGSAARSVYVDSFMSTRSYADACVISTSPISAWSVKCWVPEAESEKMSSIPR